MTPMNNAVRFGPSPEVVKQAIHWALRLRNNCANLRLHAQCKDWREAHGDHELAWQRVQALQQELNSQLTTISGAHRACG